MVDNDLICERLIMGSLNKAVLFKKIKKLWYDLFKFSAFFVFFFLFLVADSVLALLTSSLVEAAV